MIGQRLAKYRAIYYYKVDKPKPDEDLSDPESWDGQSLLDFSIPETIGTLTDMTKKEQLDSVIAQLGKQLGYSAISLIKLTQGFESGQAFMGDGESGA